VRYAYQDSSPEQLWRLDHRSMLMDVQGGEFLLDDSVVDVHPPPFASRIPKPSANAQPKQVDDDDRTPRPANPRPSVPPITSKTIERSPQTARRRRISSTKDADKTPVQLSIPLAETADNVVPEHTVVRSSRAAALHPRTQQRNSPPEISSPALGDAIIVPPALPNFTSVHKRKSSTTNAAIPPIRPKSILKRPKSTNLIQCLQPLEPEGDEVQVEPPRRQSARLSGFALPELTHPPVPFPREPEVVYESEGAPLTVPSLLVEQPTAMEWEAYPGNHSIDLRTDRGDVFVDEASVQESSRRLSVIAPTLHPEEPQPAVVQVLDGQEWGPMASESLPLLPLRSSTRVPQAQHVDAEWEMEPPIEVPPEPEHRSITRPRRSSVAAPRLLPPIDLEAVELPVPPREVEMHKPEARVEEPTVRSRRSSIRASQPPELIAVEANQQPAPLTQRAFLPTALLPSAHTTVPDALTKPKTKPSARPSVAPTRKVRRESHAPVRGRDQQVKMATSRPKRSSEVPRSLIQGDAPRRQPQSPQKRAVPTPALEPISRPISQSSTNPPTGVAVPIKPRGIPQLTTQQSTRMTTTSTENIIPSTSAPQPSRGPAVPSQTTLAPGAVPEHVVIPRVRTSIVAASATSNISAVLRPSTESERVPDDMFERRKRDNYVAKPVGLDLTDHSTRGRGLDAVGSTSVNMSLNHNDSDITLSTSMPGEWVENSSVIIRRHERSRSVSHPAPSPTLAKLVEPQDMMESQSGEDEDSEDTDVGEVLEPERMKELTVSRQRDLTIEDLAHVPLPVCSFLSNSLQALIEQQVPPVKRKPVSRLHSQSKPTSKPPSRAPSRPPLEIRAPPPRTASARPPSTIRLQPRSRSGERTEPARSTFQSRSASSPPLGKPASTAARVSEEGLGTKLAQFGEMLLNVVSR